MEKIYNKPEFMAGVLAVPLAPIMAIAYILPLAVIRAFVLSSLWSWYIVPQFGLSPLRLIFAYGLALTVGLIANGSNSDKNEKTASKSFIDSIARSLVVFVFGWLGTWFI